MPSIFISYRRSDSKVYAARIYDELVDVFGRRNIFKDVDNIPPGSDFRGVLKEAVSQCEALLVVIGTTWLNTPDKNGTRRLDDPDDFVRIEVESGLQRPQARVIPILVDGAQMPTSTD